LLAEAAVASVMVVVVDPIADDDSGLGWGDEHFVVEFLWA